MRLFEVVGNQFQDDLAEILRVLQGRANTKHTQAVLSWSAINNMMRAHGYAEINQDIVNKIKDQIDKSGDLIQNVDETGIVLKTDIASPDKEKPVGGMPQPKSVDQMAHHAVKKDL